MDRGHSWGLVIGFCLAAVFAKAETAMPIDGMEDLSLWRTGGQKEASLAPETALVQEGRQALRVE